MAIVRRALGVDRVRALLLGAKRSFRMGVAGWRFAHMKRPLSGRVVVVGLLEELPMISSVVVAVGSMILAGVMLYEGWPQ